MIDVSTRDCLYCGSSFARPTTRQQLFCSISCGVKNRATQELCMVDGCSRVVKSRGCCSKHYQRLKNHGSPDALRNARGGYSHGMSKTPTWYSWVAMIERTTSDKHRQYKDYKGRGIAVCDRWSCQRGFLNLFEDMGVRPEGMTLDRRDNDGNYEPSNCRWATYHEQRMNQRRMSNV